MAIRSCYIDAFRGKRPCWIGRDLNRDASAPKCRWAVSERRRPAYGAGSDFRPVPRTRFCVGAIDSPFVVSRSPISADTGDGSA